jgi:tight adherence protein B
MNHKTGLIRQIKMIYLDLIPLFFCTAGVITLMILAGIYVGLYNKKDPFIKNKSLRRLEKQLPTFLDTVSSSLSSGNSLLQSLENTGDKTPPPLGTVIKKLVTNVQAGMPLEQSLEKTATNFQGGSLVLTLHSMAASYRSGSNMVKSLSLLSELCRERENLQEKILARTAQSRMQGTVLILVPFFFLILLLLTSPQNLVSIMYSSLGRKILLAAISLQFGGILIIRKMLKKDILG